MHFLIFNLKNELIIWELISWEDDIVRIDFARIDLVGVDLVRIDCMGVPHILIPLYHIYPRMFGIPEPYIVSKYGTPLGNFAPPI